MTHVAQTESATDPRELISPEVRARIVETVRKQNLAIGPETAETGVGQMAAFLAACAVAERPLSPSPVVDDYWHAFVLHTEAYQNWCMDRFGKMVHHKPGFLDKVEHGGGKVLRQRAVDAITDLGFLMEPDFWPEIELAECSQCHANCSESPFTGGKI